MPFFPLGYFIRIRIVFSSWAPVVVVPGAETSTKYLLRVRRGKWCSCVQVSPREAAISSSRSSSSRLIRSLCSFPAASQAAGFREWQAQGLTEGRQLNTGLLRNKEEGWSYNSDIKRNGTDNKAWYDDAF